MKAVKGKYFFGGVHPNDRKYFAKAAPLEYMPAPEVVAISTSQSLGRPAIPIVEIGQEVKIGELIAKADGPISSDVFSSICGTIEAIRDEISASGAVEKFIFIKNNGKTDNAHLPPLTSPTADEIKARIKDAGIVGLGGAGFPTAVKVSPKTTVDTLILNGAECEPYLTCDHRLMLEKTDEIVRGARYIATALGVKTIIIGIEANKPDCIEKFEPYPDIKVVILKKKYPMGGEKQLVYVTTGRRIGLPPKLPADSGVVVQNVATAFAVCEAVEQGKQLYERVLTVSGGAAVNPKNLWVKLGTKVQNIIDYCDGDGSLDIYGIDITFDESSVYKDIHFKASEIYDHHSDEFDSDNNYTLKVDDANLYSNGDDVPFKDVTIKVPVGYVMRDEKNSPIDYVVNKSPRKIESAETVMDYCVKLSGEAAIGQVGAKFNTKVMVNAIEITVPTACTVTVYVGSGKSKTKQTANFYKFDGTSKTNITKNKANINPEGSDADNTIYVVSHKFKVSGTYYFGGETAQPKKIIQGGPMTGIALTNYEVYTHKTTSGVLLLTEHCAAADHPTPCLNCGRCADICPMHLMPMNTEFYALAGDYESAAKYGGTLACIECGACTYNCPARRPLMQAIRKTKAELRKMGGQKK